MPEPTIFEQLAQATAEQALSINQRLDVLALLFRYGSNPKPTAKPNA